MARTRPARVLRIGIIQDGKIVQEKLIDAGTSVTLGEGGQKTTFAVPRGTLDSESFTLFKYSGTGYILRFTLNMSGKLKSAGSVFSLQKLEGEPADVRDGDAYFLELTDRDRGKIDLGRVSVLFQFVTPPPVRAVRPLADMDFCPSLFDDDDPVFLGSLLIWSVFAAFFIVWSWYATPRVVTLEEIPDRFTQLMVPKAEVAEKPEPEEADVLETISEEAAPTPAPKEEEVQKGPTEEPPSEVEVARSKEDLKEEVVQQSKLLLKLIGTTGEGQGAPAEFFGDDGGTGDLDERIASTSGVTTDASQATRGGEGTDLAATDIGDLKKGGGGTADVGGGPAVRIAEVKSESGSVEELSGDVMSVKQVVKRYQGQLKYCYERRLKEAPNLEGRVEVGWYLEAGVVSQLSIVVNTTRDEELATCVKNKIRRWKFAEDAEGPVEWPFVFKARVQ
jgi:hypothetical protein